MRPDDPDTDALCLQALRGDEKAWNALVRRYDGRLFTHIMGCYGVDDIEAEEIRQEVWVRLTRKLHQRRLAELKPGLFFSEARFVLLERHRAGRRRREDLEDDPHGRLADLRPSPEEAAIRANLGVDLRRVIDQDLSPRMREVLLYGLDNGAPDARIAEVFQISVYRVRELRAEAYQRLRQALKPSAGSRRPTDRGTP